MAADIMSFTRKASGILGTNAVFYIFYLLYDSTYFNSKFFLLVLLLYLEGMTPVAIYLHTKGITVSSYTDEWWLVEGGRGRGRRIFYFTLGLLQYLHTFVLIELSQF